MIAKLSGNLDICNIDNCVIDVGGVGYLVFCSARTLATLSGKGATVSLLIETHVREDHIHLFGFAEETERDWFKQLLKVQGVGAKLALAILSALTPGELTQAVLHQDKAIMTRAPGVGPKVGNRIVSELKGKIDNLTLEINTVIRESATPAQRSTGDALSALVNLGYRPAEAQTAVQAVAKNLGDDVDLESLIRDSLRHLTS